MISFPAFFDEIEKIGFSMANVRRVIALAKPKVMRVRGGLAEMGPLSFPTQGTRQSLAALQQAAQSGAVPQHIAEGAGRTIRNLSGKITMPAGVGGASGFLHRLMKNVPEEAISGGALPRLTGQQRHALAGVFHGHELDELALAKKHGVNPDLVSRLTHVDPDVVLRERNRVLTLPEGIKQPVVQTMSAMRAPSEAPMLEQATRGVTGQGIQYGAGPRLSRHARQHVSSRMRELAMQRSPVLPVGGM